jgi:hypothetical protein
MTRHAYPTAAMLSDYARAAAGLVPLAAIFATVPLGVVGATVLGGVAGFFALFGIRTALRHGTLIGLSDTHLQARGLVRASISWSELDRLKLAYYSTRRDGRGGWMQLELRSGKSALRVDSRIEGFSRIVEVAARAAERRGLSLDPATAANLQALGVKLPAVEIGMPKTARGAA